MKITQLKAASFKLKTGIKKIGANPIEMSYIPVVIVGIYTDDGINGFCATVYITSGNVLVRYLKEVIEPLLIGEDPFYIEKINEKLMTMTYNNQKATSMLRANGIIDISLWDIIGKKLNTPIAYLLGCYNNKVKAYASTAEWKDPEVLAKDAVNFKEKGFKAIKLRVGRPKLEDDIKVVKTVRDAVGDEMVLWVDANRSYSRKNALKLAHIFYEYGIRSIEEPLNPEDTEGYEELCKKSPISIAAGENLLTLMQWKNMIQAKALDIMQPWPTQCGGISGMKKLCGLAEIFGKDIEPHSGLMVAESIQVMCSTPNCSYVMWSIAQEKIREALFEEPITPKDGYFVLNNKPGLGIKIKSEYLEKLE